MKKDKPMPIAEPGRGPREVNRRPGETVLDVCIKWVSDNCGTANAARMERELRGCSNAPLVLKCDECHEEYQPGMCDDCACIAKRCRLEAPPCKHEDTLSVDYESISSGGHFSCAKWCKTCGALRRDEDQPYPRTEDVWIAPLRNRSEANDDELVTLRGICRMAAAVVESIESGEPCTCGTDPDRPCRQCGLVMRLSEALRKIALIDECG